MISKEELHDMYWNRSMTMNEISRSVDVSIHSIYRWMAQYEIKSRTISESKLIEVRVPTKNELDDMYWNQGMSLNEIGKEIGVNKTTVRNWMGKHGIKSRTVSETASGINNPSWKGGISSEPYCNKFNNNFKESIRARDDYTCQLCGCEQLLGGQKLDVHHIHYDKSNCYPDVVALCRPCNGRVNGNRDYWEQYFEEQLLQRGMLN